MQPHCAIRRRSCLLRCHGHGDDYDISGLAAVVKDINENSGVRISSVRVLQGSDKERLQKIGIMTNDDMMVGEFDGRYHLFVTPRIASAPEKLKGKDPGGSSSTFTQREGTLGANLAEGIGVVLDLLNFNLQRTDDHRTSPKLISLNSSFADWFPESGHLAREQSSVPTFGELAERQEPANATPGVYVAAAAAPEVSSLVIMVREHVEFDPAEGAVIVHSQTKSPAPARPSKDNSVNPRGMKEWVDRHPSELRPLAESIGKNITRVRQDEFEEALEETFLDFKSKVEGRPYVIVMGDQPIRVTSGHIFCHGEGLGRPRAYCEPLRYSALAFENLTSRMLCTLTMLPIPADR